MPQNYEVTAPNGKTLEITGDRMPTEDELHDIFAKAGVETGAAPSQGNRMTFAVVNGQRVPVNDGTPPPENPFNPAMTADMLKQEQQRTQSGADFLAGVGKSALGTIEGGGKLLRQIPVVGPLLSKGPEVNIPVSTEPSNASQQFGKTVGNIGQYFLPGAALGKAKAALATGHGILDALVGAGLEGASAAGVQSAQQGSTEGAGKTAALTAGTSVGMQAAMSGLGLLGQRVEQALVKPTAADIKNGFQAGNIFKYNLGGSLTTTYDKADAKINELSRSLQQALRATSAGPAPQVDVLQALADTSADLSKNAARTFGSNTAISNAVDKLLDDPMFQTIAQTGKVDLATANQVKQAVGDMGAWLHDPSGRVLRDPESKGMEVVANALYTKLKDEIAAKAVGPVAAINQQLSEILPIRQAVIRRIPIEQRANVLNLGDLLSYSAGTWGLSLANRLLKSGQAANAMVGASSQAAPAAAAVARTTAAAASQVPR